MSVQNAMRQVKLTNQEHTARRLRMEIERLCKTICINLDCSMQRPEALLISEVDSQWDELKNKWVNLTIVLEEIARLKAELE